MINAPHTNAIDIDIVAHAGLYAEISPRGGGEFGVWTKELGGGAPGGSSVVSCEVYSSLGGARMTQGGRMPPLNTALT